MNLNNIIQMLIRRFRMIHCFRQPLILIYNNSISIPIWMNNRGIIQSILRGKKNKGQSPPLISSTRPSLSLLQTTRRISFSLSLPLLISFKSSFPFPDFLSFPPLFPFSLFPTSPNLQKKNITRASLNRLD